MPETMITRRGALAAMAGGPFAAAAAARAQTAVPPGFPAMPLSIVCPLGPGGPGDALSRFLAQGFQARTGRTAVVDIRPGGGGNIGIEFVHRAPADGSTMLVIPAGNMTINPTLLRGLPFVVERDFVPVSMLATTPNVIVAGGTLRGATLQDVIRKAKATPGGLTYGSPGIGSQLHLLMEMVKSKTGAPLVHVPYRGMVPALNDLVAGHLELVSSNLPAALPFIQAGQFTAVAMTTAERSPLLPEVPTMGEAGVAGIDVSSWYGLFVPTGVPAAMVQAIYEEARLVLNVPETAQRVRDQGLDLVCEPPAPFGERLKRETASWATVIRENGITVD